MIVGIVGDVKDKPASPEAQNAFWWPIDQTPVFVNQMSIALRGSSDPALLVNDLREAVRQIDPSLAIAEVRFGLLSCPPASSVCRSMGCPIRSVSDPSHLTGRANLRV